MKNVTFSLCALLCLSIGVKAQDNLNDLLAAGVADAGRFTNSYLAPGTNSAMYSMNNGWFNTAKVKKFLDLRFL